MRKTMMLAVMMIMSVMALGASQAFAVVPSINGTIAGGEWDNVATGGAYPYYLNVLDVNEAAITDNYDISRVVLLQELDAYNGDGISANDGVYLMIETYANPTLADGGAGFPFATISMNGDFNGDGIFDIAIVHRAVSGDGSIQVVEVYHAGGIDDLVLMGGSYSMGPDGIEYFLPTGTFSTPSGVPFPGSFIGNIVYDNGGQEPDDLVIGTLIPEPGTMALVGFGLLSMIGAGSKLRMKK